MVVTGGGGGAEFWKRLTAGWWCTGAGGKRSRGASPKQLGGELTGGRLLSSSWNDLSKSLKACCLSRIQDESGSAWSFWSPTNPGLGCWNALLVALVVVAAVSGREKEEEE